MDKYKHYGLDEIVESLMSKGELSNYYNNYQRILVIKDDKCFWIHRTLQGFNSKYEKDESSPMVIEREFIHYSSVVEKHNELYNTNHNPETISDTISIVNSISDEELIRTILVIDNERVTENWGKHITNEEEY